DRAAPVTSGLQARMWTKTRAVLMTLCVSAPALAADPPPAPAPPPPPAPRSPEASPAVPLVVDYQDSDELTDPESNAAPALAAPTGFGAGLEGYGGLALLVGPGPTRSRAVVGGLLRLRYHYVQVGGSIEVSDA